MITFLLFQFLVSAERAMVLTSLWDSQPEKVEFFLGHQHLNSIGLARGNLVTSPSFPTLKMKQQQCFHLPREAL